MQTVLGFWDFFWIALVVTTFSGGTHLVMRNGGESEPLTASHEPDMNLRARIKARLMEKRRPLMRASKWKTVRRPADALS